MIDIEYNLKRDDLDSSSPVSFIVSLAKSYGGGIIYAAKLTKEGLQNEWMSPEQPWGLYHCANKNEGFEVLEKSPYVDHYCILYEESFGPIEGDINSIIKPIFDKLKIALSTPKSKEISSIHSPGSLNTPKIKKLKIASTTSKQNQTSKRPLWSKILLTAIVVGIVAFMVIRIGWIEPPTIYLLPGMLVLLLIFYWNDGTWK
jgi:hypothetical protein